MIYKTMSIISISNLPNPNNEELAEKTHQQTSYKFNYWQTPKMIDYNNRKHYHMF